MNQHLGKETGHKHDACYVATSVGEKAHLGMKQHQAVKKSSL